MDPTSLILRLVPNRRCRKSCASCRWPRFAARSCRRSTGYRSTSQYGIATVATSRFTATANCAPLTSTDGHYRMPVRQRTSAAHPSTASSASTGRSPQSVSSVKPKSRSAKPYQQSSLRSYVKITIVGLLGAFVVWRAYLILVQQRNTETSSRSAGKVNERPQSAIPSTQVIADTPEAVIEKREAVREAFRVDSILVLLLAES